MAYHYLCSSSSSLFHDPHPLSAFPKPRPITITASAPSLNLLSTSFQSKTSIQLSHVSLQEDPIIQDAHYPPKISDSPYANAKTASSSASSKSSAWVNPRSPQASRLRRLSYDSRYSSLVKLAEVLDSCHPNEQDVLAVLSSLGDDVSEQDAVVVLNNMSNPQTALLALKHFQTMLKKPSREVILYNVTIKVFRKAKDLDGAEKLFHEMLQRGIMPDNITFFTLISCARVCAFPAKAVEWFEKMPTFGCHPDDVLYSAMIDAYGRAGNVDMAFALYDRARTEKWRIDTAAFSTLIKIHGTSGNYDGCLNVYEEMKALGAKPNLLIYNNLLDAMGRAKRPWQAKTIYNEMTTNGFSPNWATYAALLRAYGRARYGEDALNVYKEMKDKGLELTVPLYNTLLAVCADVGYADEAVEIFEHMKNSGTCKPDSWTFSSMITVYACSGKVSEAEGIVNEMLEACFEPTIFVLTSLIQCYGKAQRTDDVVRTFNQVLELGITPDDRLYCCLLNVMTQLPREELAKLKYCIEKANPKLGLVVKLLLEEQTGQGNFKNEASELFDYVGSDIKRAYCNCLIDICVNLDLLERACDLLELGLSLELYAGIQSRSPNQWSLNLKSLSHGAALTAFHVWINDLTKVLESGEELPPLLGINTGHGKHRYSEKGLLGINTEHGKHKYSEKGLAAVFESHLKELNAPFHEAPDKIGWFLTTKVAAKSWLESRCSPDLQDA